MGVACTSFGVGITIAVDVSLLCKIVWTIDEMAIDLQQVKNLVQP